MIAYRYYLQYLVYPFLGISLSWFNYYQATLLNKLRLQTQATLHSQKTPSPTPVISSLPLEQNLQQLEATFLNLNLRLITFKPDKQFSGIYLHFKGSETSLKTLLVSTLTLKGWLLKKALFTNENADLSLEIYLHLSSNPKLPILSTLNFEQRWFYPLTSCLNEQWKVEQLVFLATFQDKQQTFAVMRTPTGNLFSVKAGDLLEENRYKIINIEPQRIILEPFLTLEIAPI